MTFLYLAGTAVDFGDRLNSTLSVRIEEQNARISFLETENLRLLTEKNAIALELRRERSKSRRIIEEAESLVRNLNHSP
jgi:hypothetical protein